MLCRLSAIKVELLLQLVSNRDLERQVLQIQKKCATYLTIYFPVVNPIKIHKLPRLLNKNGDNKYIQIKWDESHSKIHVYTYFLPWFETITK